MAEAGGGQLIKQGAEAKIYSAEFLGHPAIIKERFSKKYRHPVLDKSLTQQRTKSEVRSMIRCRMNGQFVLLLNFWQFSRALYRNIDNESIVIVSALL